MQKSKLIGVLKTFSNDEIKHFNDFVNSPFFNKEKVLVKLADYLKSYHPSYSDPAIENEVVFDFLYPGKKYNDGLMRNVISDLFRLSEGFLAESGLQSDNFRKSILLLNELSRRSLGSHFIKSKEKLDSQIEQIPVMNETYFDMKTELLKLHNNFLAESRDTYLKEDEMIQELSDLMTSGFLVKMIYYNTLMINRQAHISNFNFRLNMAEEIDAFFTNNGRRYLGIPYIQARYLSFKLFQTRDEKYYYDLKYLLEDNFVSTDTGDIKNIYTVLENFCYSKVMEGNGNFTKELFSLYRQSEERGILKGSKNYIPSVLFMSVAVTGFEAGEFEWTQGFIDKYIKEVKQELRNDIYHFCLALSFYWTKQFDNALKELAKVTTEEFSLKQNTKALYLKIYFDLNETEPFYSHIDTYKHFVLNNKNVHDKVREQVNNFINYSKRLFALKSRGDAEKEMDLDLLKKEINSNTALINKIWLLRKAGEASE